MQRYWWLSTFVLAAPTALVAAFLLLIALTPPPPPAPLHQVLSATAHVYQPYTPDIPSLLVSATAADGRTITIKNYLSGYASPLEPFAADIVRFSDFYRIDPYLIVAIAQQESNLCKKIPPASHNCWGYGIYGDKVTRFTSYPEAIETVVKGLRKNYFDAGLDTPEEIMAKYTPPSLEKGGPWATGVQQFLAEMQ